MFPRHDAALQKNKLRDPKWLSICVDAHEFTVCTSIPMREAHVPRLLTRQVFRGV